MNSIFSIIITLLILFSSNVKSFDPTAIEEFPESSFLLLDSSKDLVISETVKPNRMIASIEKYPYKFQDEILFWQRIYTKYPDEIVLIHDKNDLGLIYKILNFNALKKKSRNLVVYEVLKNRSLRRNVQKLKNDLKKCDKHCRTNLLKNKKYNTKKLRMNMRTQTGQKDIIARGLIRLKKVQKEISYLFKETKAEPQWIALPFLESSFNEKAVSKVNAGGAWQIMPWIGKKLLPKNKFVDARFNIYLSTLAAIQLLKQNYRITKSNEISIIAYNSGLRTFFKTKKKLNKEKISYIDYLDNAAGKSFGFASRNFLMEYFALQESISPKSLINIKNSKTVDFYISRCKTKPLKVLNLLKRNEANIFKKNNHFKNKSKVLAPGQIYITNVKLPNKYYRKVKKHELKRKAPNEWIKGTTFKTCKII